jgi:N-acetyl-alpha-D-glucosaminyl L-malate synthase BshA
MNIGIVCYASVGGSGIVATELAKCLAVRGHDVHMISTDMPFRYAEFQPGLSFHRVNTPAYPLFREPQYVLSLATKIVRVAREFSLDVIHAHYAVPHATAAYLARQILLSTEPGCQVPRVITTLHGTDITLVGSDRSYSETVAFSIENSDGVTAVSESLREDTYRTLHVRRDITVIPNFLDCGRYHRVPDQQLRHRLVNGDDDKIVMHISNFRPVKRADIVVKVFAKIAACVPSRLVLVGDGPDLEMALDQAHELGVADRVEALGEQDQVVPLLSVADLFLLPSAQESFGLAALEAMACEVPVVASDVGGLHEVVENGRTGFLHALDDVEGMAESGIRLLRDGELHARMAQAGRAEAGRRFCADLVVPQYEAFYTSLIDPKQPAAASSGVACGGFETTN